MNQRALLVFALATTLALSACGSGSSGDEVGQTSSTATSTTSTEADPNGTVRDIAKLADFADLDPGRYSIDPDADPATPLRVTYDVGADGWSQWIGAVKFGESGHTSVSIATVTNITRDACLDHSPAEPAIGPSVEDLATGLAQLTPFEVTTAPEDVSLAGYDGKYLVLAVPNLPVEGDDFTGCVGGKLESWIAPVLAPPDGEPFFGYNAEPGRSEEFWILDVDDTRLVVAATWSEASPSEDVAEMRSILESIEIQP